MPVLGVTEGQVMSTPERAAMREYWCAAVEIVPDLHFEIVDDGLVRRGHGTYQLGG